jgi:ATP-binding cassette subfamily B protein
MLFAGSLVVAFACQYGETILTGLLGQRVMRDLRHAIFAHVQRLPVVFFDRNPVGRLVTRVTSDVESLNELFTAGVVAGLGDLFTLAAISALMLVTDWRLALASFGVIPFVYWASHLFRAKVRDSYRDIRTRLGANQRLSARSASRNARGAALRREETEARRFGELNRGHLQANLDSITYYALYFPAIEILTSIALASLIGRRRASRPDRLSNGWYGRGVSCSWSGGFFNRCKICPTSSTRCSRRWPHQSVCSGCSTPKPPIRAPR